jgi:hypothetical protein
MSTRRGREVSPEGPEEGNTLQRSVRAPRTLGGPSVRQVDHGRAVTESATWIGECVPVIVSLTTEEAKVITNKKSRVAVGEIFPGTHDHPNGIIEVMTKGKTTYMEEVA